MKTIEKANAPGYQSSIGHVHYKQMPAGFTGNVYYFTFDKQFIVGYGWDKGILAKQLSIASAGTQTQTTRRGKISTNQLALHCQDVLYDYYTYRIDENGHIFDFRYDHSFTVYECELVNEGDYTSGGSSGGVPNDPTPTRVPWYLYLLFCRESKQLKAKLW